MVSSTFTGLQNHRAALVKVIDSEGLKAVGMENDSAKPIDVIESSLQMVRDASAYIGLISCKYGQTPNNDRSLTELEFNEARHQNRPILLFIMSPDHPVLPRDVETDPARIKKLNAFRERAKLMKPNSQVHRVYAIFNSLEEFNAKAIHAVAGFRRHLEAEPPCKSDRPRPLVAGLLCRTALHRLSLIPRPASQAQRPRRLGRPRRHAPGPLIRSHRRHRQEHAHLAVDHQLCHARPHRLGRPLLVLLLRARRNHGRLLPSSPRLNRQ
jgi:hypothetical protein